MPTTDKIVLYGDNGDSIAGANTFAELLQNAPMLVDSTADTSGMTVTVAGPNGFRAMPLKRALQDYLTESDKAQAIAKLKDRATTANKLAKWLVAQPANGEAGPTGTAGATGPGGPTGATGPLP